MIAEITASPAAVEALLGEADPSPRALEAAGAGAGEALHPLLVAGLAAASEPAFRIWTDGIEPGVTVLGDRAGAVVLTEEPAGERTLLGVSFDEVALVLVGALALEPRPSSDEPPLRLEPSAMAELSGRGQVERHGLPGADAEALGRRLELGVRHWSVTCAASDGLGGAIRREIQVVEGEAGIWRVRTVAGGLVDLVPTTSTAVLRDLVALLGNGAAAGDGRAAAAAPASSRELG